MSRFGYILADITELMFWETVNSIEEDTKMYVDTVLNIFQTLNNS